MTMRAKLAVAGASTAALLAPAAAFAQFAPLAPVNPGDRNTQVDLIANLIYNSNVASSDATLAAARHIKPSDVIVEPEIRLDLSRPVGRQTLYLIADAAYNAYTRNSVLDRENILVNPGVLGQFSRCEYDVSGSYTRAQSDLAEQALTPTGPISQQLRNTLEVKQITAGGDCGRQVGLAPNVRVTQSWANNSSPLERGVNVNSFSTQDGIAYRRPSFGSLTLFGAYSKTSYPERSPFDILFHLPPTNAGYETYSGGISYTRPVGARLVGSASVSYTDLKNALSSVKGFSGITYSAALTYSVSPRLTTAVNIERATLPSNRLNSTFRIEDLYSTEVDYRVTTRGFVRTGVSYEHDKYGGASSMTFFDLTDEKIYSGFISAEYRLSRLLSVAVEVNQAHRDANFPGLTYDDTRATLSFRTSF